MDEIDILPIVFIRSDYNYIGGNPACRLPQNLGSTKGVLLIPYMRKLLIKDKACTYVAMDIGPLIYLGKLLLCVEGVQHLVILILVLTLTKILRTWRSHIRVCEYFTLILA